MSAEPLNAERVEELRQLEAEATPGPWTCTEYHTVVSSTGRLIDYEDARFIAAMRNSLPELLATWEQNERQEDTLGRLREEIHPDHHWLLGLVDAALAQDTVERDG